MRIEAQKNAALNDADRLQLVTLLAKAGYTVRIGRTEGKPVKYYVEYTEPETARKGKTDD